jgi:hypothetical protein
LSAARGKGLSGGRWPTGEDWWTGVVLILLAGLLALIFLAPGCGAGGPQVLDAKLVGEADGMATYEVALPGGWSAAVTGPAPSAGGPVVVSLPGGLEAELRVARPELELEASQEPAGEAETAAGGDGGPDAQGSPGVMETAVGGIVQAVTGSPALAYGAVLLSGLALEWIRRRFGGGHKAATA